jgi:hypothetical protein
MQEYSAPTLTRIGSFEVVTKSIGTSIFQDIFGFPAWGWLADQ